MTKEPQVSEPPDASATAELPTPRDTPSTESASSAARGTTRNAPPDITTHQVHVAMTWAQRGMGIVPCSRRDKGAMVRGFGKDATDADLAKFYDPEQVHRWFTGEFRRAHVGLLTRSLVVVDCDIRKPGTEITGRFADAQGGTDVLEALMHDAGAEWPETYTVMTPSGGLHLYFLQPDGEPIGCATGDGTRAPHVGPLVDIRGVGGYAIAAGSYSTAQGQPYRRVSPPELRPQPLPEWLLAILQRPDPMPVSRTAAPPITLTPGSSRADRYAVKALEGQADAVRAAGETSRWKTLTAATFRLAELSTTAPAVLTESAVRDQLLAAAAACGLPDREAERAFNSAWAKGTSGRTLGGAA